jgi:hypothetical protein
LKDILKQKSAVFAALPEAERTAEPFSLSKKPAGWPVFATMPPS